MTALGLLVFGTGVVLIYSGVKNEDPRDVLRGVLSGRPVGNKPKAGNNPASSGKSGLPGKGGDGSSGGGLGGGGGGSW